MNNKQYFYIFTIGILVTPFIIYYISDYFFLRQIFAECTSFFLNQLGITTNVLVEGNNIFIEFHYFTAPPSLSVNKDCTSIFLFAIFSGFLIFTPKNSIKRKVFTGILAFSFYFVLNLLRLIIQSYFFSSGFTLISFHNDFTMLAFTIIGSIILSIIIFDFLLENYLKFLRNREWSQLN